MKDWKEYRLGEVTTSIQTGPFGSQLHMSDYSDEGIPVVMPKDMLNGKISEISIARVSEEHVNRLSRHKVADGDILYARRGDIGRCVYISEKENGWLCGTGCLKLEIDRNKADPMFLFLQLQNPSIISLIENRAVGATMPNLNTEILKKVSIKLPPLSTQQKIASILSAYDNLIQNYKKQIEALQAAASELYKEWFVRFRFPGWQTTRFENGIPEGWKIERLGKLAEIKSGKRLPQGYDFSDCPTSHPYIRARDIKHGNIDSNDFAYISDDVYQKLKRYIVDENDILLTIVANIGDVGYVNKSLQGFNLTENAVRLTHYSDRIEPRYLCYYLSQPTTKIYMEGLAVGAAQAKLGIYKIETIKVLLPNINIQKDFSSRITKIHTKIDNLNKQITNLTQQRDLLLPRLMSGKLEVLK